MVDITDKVLTTETQRLKKKFFINNNILNAIKENTISKGNVLTVAKVSAIQAAKKVAELIPMCHQINLTFVDINFSIKEYIKISSTVKTNQATGVEIEAMMAVSNAALTIYDMCKSIDKHMKITDIELIQKKGGKTFHDVSYRQGWYYYT